MRARLPIISARITMKCLLPLRIIWTGWNSSYGTVTFQWDRVKYSNIPESLSLDDQTIDDADELHLGAEYVFLDSTPVVAVRFGTWYDPDHQMRPIIDDPWLDALTVNGDDEFHFTAGLGVALERSQFDIAVDLSERVDTVAVSAIFNF